MGGHGSGGHNRIDDRLKLKGRQWEFCLWMDSAPKDWLSALEDLKMPIAVSPVHNLDYYCRRDFARNPEILKRHVERLTSDEFAEVASAGFVKVFDHERVEPMGGAVIDDSSELLDHISWCIRLYNHFSEDGLDYFPDDDRLPLIMKPAHRHVIMDWRNSSLNRLIDELGDKLRYFGLDPLRNVRPVSSMDGFVPYLCHLYNNDKVHYPIEQIICLNGFKVFDYIDKEDRENETYRERAINLARTLKTNSWGYVYDFAKKDEQTLNLSRWIWKHQKEFSSYLKSLYFDEDGNLLNVKMSDNISSDNTN